ncbi:unnamed protein product [Phytophthora lilii]|uniref:Unnamed protein product n=1 Tax=Phytophthora lilii TaxID=2077276 RepID=A0A9W7CR03_9STRA|nr:unnamed protein product [Phytophthora lilii]
MKTIPAEAIIHQKAQRHNILSRKWRCLHNIWWERADVVPVGPRVHDIPSSRKLLHSVSTNLLKLQRQSVVAITLKYVSFRDAFGLLGPPMVVVASLCISWTVFVIILTIAPNQTANFIMKTSDYDDGQFWLIPDKLTTLHIVSVVGLSFVTILYALVLLKMLLWRAHRPVEGMLLDRLLQLCAVDEATGSAQLQFSHRVRLLIWELYLFIKELTGFHGKYRKFWAFDLSMQTFLLSRLFENGSPVYLTLGFAVFMALNSATCAFQIIGSKHSAFAEILIDSMFDLGATVLFPIVVLVYCSQTFDFDHAVFQINMELMPIGSFERRARMFADPTEIEQFRVSLDALRILSLPDFFLRIGMNLGFSYRFKRVVEVLIQMQTQSQRDKIQKKSLKHKRNILKLSTQMSNSQRCQQSVPRPLALVFLTFTVGVLVVTHRAISTSQVACSEYPECVVFAYRWRNSEVCPCRALVDGDRAPRTYYEWTHPVNITETVKELAAAGTLATLQDMVSLSNKLYVAFLGPLSTVLSKNCRQIEGKVGSRNLGNLASDLFSDMPELRYLQFGLHQRMTRLPPLTGAPNLCCIVLARMDGLVELPTFSGLSELERIEFTMVKNLPWIPDLKPIGPLVHFAIYQGAYLCCNGFLGSCNLTNPFCATATCLKKPTLKATPATKQAFDKFSFGVCQPYNGVSQTPTAKTIQICDGVPYRQCRVPGLEPNTTVVGMCYNHRMQVLACNPDPATIQVRRRQIQDRVGAPCNPIEEAWLGCNDSTKK